MSQKKDMSIDEIIDLLVEVRTELEIMKKSINSDEILNQLEGIIINLDVVGCEIVQNIAKKIR